MKDVLQDDIMNKETVWEEMNRSELTKIDSSAISTILSTKEIGEVIQPLIKEVHLFDTFVAGTTHLEDETVLLDLKKDQLLILEREKNKFDDNAIRIMTEERRKIGYIPEKDNLIFARLMDAGKLLRARIRSIDQIHGFTKIEIGIFLVDV